MTLDPRAITNDKFSFTNDDFTGENIQGDTPEDASLYTLEDSLSETHLTPRQQHRHSYGVYDLPTHISSHSDVLQEGSARTQPSTPVSTPFQERPNHPLRALTSTHLVLNQQNGTDDSLLSLENTPRSSLQVISARQEAAVEEEGEDWDKRGAAQLIKQETDELTGETEEVIIRRSVKDFKFGKTLGVGSYSTVLLATDKNTGRSFAVKVLDKRHIIREKKVKYVNIEKNTLNRLGKRDGIIHLFFTFQDESSLYFVLDYASNGELLNLIKQYGTLNEAVTRYYGAQILDAIKYMHENGVVHRDLKPENILLDERNRVQITDFGTAKLLEKNDAGRYPSDTKAKSFVGTAEYVSPELLNEKAIGKPCDIWAFGCIVYQMIAGKPPFKAPNEYLTFQKIVKLQYAFTAGFPMSCRDLIKKILVLNPKDRYGLKEIQQHHFFQNIDFSKPEESIWKPDPPEIGPYKMTAKSMLPIPELHTQASSSRLKVNLPPKRIASSSSSSIPTANTSTSSIDVEATESNDSTSSSGHPQQPTQSQQVLMRAQAAVAARKQQKQQESKRIGSTGNASANAASIALSRQPNEIIKAYSERQEKDKKVKKELEKLQTGDEVRTPPLSSSSNFKETPPSTGNKKTSIGKTLRERRKPPPSSVSPTVTSPMTKLDFEFSNYLQNIDERILYKGDLNTYITSVDAIEKRYRGRLVDSPLGGNKSTTSSLLTQVANGSLSGLRGDIGGSNGSDSDKSSVIHHNTEGDENKDPGSGGGVGGAKNKFKKFFTGGNASGSTGDDKKNRVLVVTSNGRALIFAKVVRDNNDTLEIKTEIDLTNPVIKVKEILPPAIKSVNTGGLFVIQSLNTAFVFESSQTEVSNWTAIIHKARTLSNEKHAQQLIEKDPSGGAGTILGSDAAKSAANLASIGSPPLSAQSNGSNELKSPILLGTKQFEGTSSNELKHKPSKARVSSSSTTTKHEGMFKDLVRSRTSHRTSSSTTKELPNNGQLNYGLPNPSYSPSSPTATLTSPTTRVLSNGSSSSSRGNKNPLIAAAEAAISNQRSKTLTDQHHHPEGSPNTGGISGSSNGNSSSKGRSISGVPQNVPRLITGMNSRLLARSHDRKKK